MLPTISRGAYYRAAFIMLAAALPVSSYAAYPNKPIEILVAFAPGGGTDIAARSIAHYLEKHLGNNGFVE